MLKRVHTQQIAFTTADNALALGLSVLAALKMYNHGLRTYVGDWKQKASVMTWWSSSFGTV
jgi:hypothetical protein